MRRLKTRPQFQATLAAGAASRTAHFVLHRLPLRDGQEPHPPKALGPAPAELFAGAGPWIGALVPKRWARRAVTRNAIKRQIYAVSNDCADRFLPGAHVVRLRAPFDRQMFTSASSAQLKALVRRELEQLLRPGGGLC